MKIYLVSAPERLKYLIENKTPYVLVSYYYFRTKKTQEKLAKCYSQFKDVIVDSGAFSMINDYKKAIDLNKYIDGYIEFIKKFDVKHYIELDVDNVVGYKKVLEFRKKLESKTGKQSIPVWHKSRGKDEWLNTLKDYDYVAIGGFVTREIKRNNFSLIDWLLHTAKDAKTKVHGLGYTSIKYLNRAPFFSVDSTTWRLGAAYKQLYKFQSGNLKTYISNWREQKLSEQEMNKFNCREWTKFAYWAEMHL